MRGERGERGRQPIINFPWRNFNNKIVSQLAGGSWGGGYMRRSTMVRRWVVSHPLPQSVDPASRRHGGTRAGMSAHCMVLGRGHWLPLVVYTALSVRTSSNTVCPVVVEIVVRAGGKRQSIGCVSRLWVRLPTNLLFFSSSSFFCVRAHNPPRKQGSTLASIPTRQAHCILLVPCQLSHVELVDLSSSDVQSGDSRG